MKDLMQKVMSFVTFEFATDRNCLSQQFNAAHILYQKDIPVWSTNATRQKVIAKYWFELVLSHFYFLFGFPALLFLAVLIVQRVEIPLEADRGFRWKLTR